MQVTLKVKRFDPEIDDGQTYTQEYALGVEDYETLLDSLIRVREELDESLALRCSCRAAICGSCAMRVNGHARLACKTKLSEVIDKDGLVEIEPMGNQVVLKDLVVDMQTFWNKIRSVDPWVQPSGPEPQGEYIVSNESMLNLIQTMGCIMCGACVSDCTVMEVDRNFLGPAALAKAFRLVNDPRDGRQQQRLDTLTQYGGIWDCTRCFECVQACPKGVDPMYQIMALREEAVASGMTNTIGARHVEIFAELVGHSGWLDELRLAIRTPGLFNIKAQIRNAPVGIRAALRGKLPPIFHMAIPGAESVRRIFKRIEGNS